MKTKEELNALKEEVETLNKKLAELSEEELAQVSGGAYQGACMEMEKEMERFREEMQKQISGNQTVLANQDPYCDLQFLR